MIRVSMLFPDREGASFDMNYYLNSHMPMIRKKLGSALLRDEIWKGLGGPRDQPATYRVLQHLYFDSPGSFNIAFHDHARNIMADIPNFTNVEPVIEAEDKL
jgi:uncharacterized protein (TIGR02118 family)